MRVDFGDFMLKIIALVANYNATKAIAEQTKKDFPLAKLDFYPLFRSLGASPLTYTCLCIYDVSKFEGTPYYEYVSNYMKQKRSEEKANRYAFWMRMIYKVQMAYARGESIDSMLAKYTPFCHRDAYYCMYDFASAFNFKIIADMDKELCLEVLEIICANPVDWKALGIDELLAKF